MGRKPKWTEETLAEAAKQFTTRKEFAKGNGAAYQAAVRRRILDDICGHMEAQLTYWTEEMLAEAAKLFRTRWEFQKENKAAYNAAQKRGILDGICGHMEAQLIYWTDEMLSEAAKPYTTRGEFVKGNMAAYAAAHKRGILDDICAHIPKFSGKNTDLPQYMYQYSHPEGYVYVGITNDPAGRHEVHSTNGHNEEAKEMALTSAPAYYERHVQYLDRFEPYPIDHDTAERLERFSILRLCRHGYRVVNKRGNPQYSFALKAYEWEVDDNAWCLKHYRSSRHLGDNFLA